MLLVGVVGLILLGIKYYQRPRRVDNCFPSIANQNDREGQCPSCFLSLSPRQLKIIKSPASNSTKMKLARLVCLLSAWWATHIQICQAGFGDYVDPTFNCPATTTCPKVCASSYEACPEQLRCPEPLQLCADGSCDAFCSPNLVSPCEKECALVACPKMVATLDTCINSLGPWYEHECSEEEIPNDDANEYNPSWFDPGFMLTYIWVITNTAGIVAWSWYK